MLTEDRPKVNKAYYRLIRASPSIQYEVDLFAAGLQRNPRIEPSMISDCRGALSAYLGRWKTLDPLDEWKMTIRGDSWGPIDVSFVNGVCGLLWKDSVRFFLLGSVSRGIPGRAWMILFRGFEASAFTFNPMANVMAVVGEEPSR